MFSPKAEKNTVNAEFSRVGTFVRYTARDVLKSTVRIEVAEKERSVHVLHRGHGHKRAAQASTSVRRAAVKVHQIALAKVSLHQGGSSHHCRKFNQRVFKGARDMDWFDCRDRVKLPHTSREWHITKARCLRLRSLHSRIQECRPVLPLRAVATFAKCPLCHALKRPTSRQEEPPRAFQGPAPSRLVICFSSAAL